MDQVPVARDFEEQLTQAVFGSWVIIAFAGGPQNRYQWRSVLEHMPCSYVLIRDTTQRYNHDGVLGIGDRSHVLNYFRGLRGRFRLVFTGVSSGAYPALMYGQLTPADRVVVFSALTGRQVDDFPPEDHQFIFDPKHPDVDLRQFFPNGPRVPVTSFISDGEGTRLDRKMSERIGIEDIQLVPGYSHGDLARGMRDAGMLQGVFG